MTLKAGDLGIDYSGARPDPADTKKNGAEFIIRYSAGAGNDQSATAWKLCGLNEIHAAVAAGLDVIANSEWYETRITEGAAAGKVDGAADLKFWKARGLAKGASIYVSWDTDPQQAHWPKADAYLTAYQKALGGYYHVDCYAGTPYLKHAKAKGLIRFGWRPNAGSWSDDGLPYQPDTSTAAKRTALVKQALTATPAHIWQTGNYWFSKQADENMLLRLPVGSHLEQTVPTPNPKPAPKPASTHPAIAHIRDELQKVLKQHPKKGPLHVAVQKALDDLKGI